MSVMRKALLSSVALSFCLFQSVAAETGVTDKEILIGTSNVLSGPNAFAGRETNVGINSYIDSVNDQGGINGRKIRVISEDDRYEPDGAIGAFKKMQDHGVFALTGLYGSACCAKYVPMCMSNKTPVVGIYPGTSFIGDPVKRYVFTARASYRDEMHQTVSHLWKDMGLHKIGVIYQNDAYGADCLEGIKEQLHKLHSEVVAASSYTRQSNNMKEAFETVRAASPQAVILVANFKPCTEVMKLAKEAKWNPIWIMDSGTSTDLFIPEAGADSEGKLTSEVVPPISRVDLPLIANYLKAIKHYYPDSKPGLVSLRGYVDAMALVEGLRRTGKDLTREKFCNAMERINNLDVGLGPDMKLNYSDTNHLGFRRVFFGVINNGQIESVADWKKLAAGH